MPISRNDLKHAVRLLVKTPWLTLLTVLVLAGGLGVSVYTFAVLNTLIYRDLPLPDAGSIVRIGVGDWPSFAPLDAFELVRIRDESQSIRELGAYRTSRALIGDAGSSRGVRSVEADWAIFQFSRTPPRLGRGFVREDSSAAAEPVAVLSYGTWQSLFSGDADVVGRIVRINDQPTRVVGVMPEGYAFPVNSELWLPLARQELDPAGYSGATLEAYARLRRGVSVEAAETELTGLLRRVREQRADGLTRNGAVDSVSLPSFQEEQWGVLGTVIFGVLNLLALSILLLAAVNVGNLLLARTNARIREIGVRVALGAPRARLVLQTTLENVILCAVGGTLATYVIKQALDATDSFMSALLGADLPFWWTWGLDRDAVLAAAAFLLFTVFVVSVVPALSVSRVDPNALLKDSSGGRGGVGTGRISRALVTVQVALISAVMLVGSVVALIAERAASFEFGIETSDLLTLGVELPERRYATAEAQLSFHERLLAQLREAAGISEAAVMQEAGTARFRLEGNEYATPKDYPGGWLVVLSESPSPIGPALLEGRRFDGRDGATGPKTVIVSESLARAQWPGESALGRRIEVSIPDRRPEERVIVGVVGDVEYDPIGITPIGPSAMYVPLPQLLSPSTRILVRHLGDEARARSAIYETLQRLDPAIVPDVRSFTAVVEQMTVFARTTTKLFLACGAFAVLLAITGIYGMSSNAVVLRSHEIGLRRALGASNGNVIAMFITRGSRQLVAGLSLSALLSVTALFVIRQGFSVGAWTLALIGASVGTVVSATVLLAIYVSVCDVVRREPAATLRYS